jgi:hypothetical protein
VAQFGERCVSWSSHSHNLKVVGSNPTPATKNPCNTKNLNVDLFACV